MWTLTKGAPEVVKEFLQSPPDDYEAAYQEFAAQGGRYDPITSHKLSAPFLITQRKKHLISEGFLFVLAVLGPHSGEAGVSQHHLSEPSSCT